MRRRSKILPSPIPLPPALGVLKGRYPLLVVVSDELGSEGVGDYAMLGVYVNGAPEGFPRYKIKYIPIFCEQRTSSQILDICLRMLSLSVAG